MYTTTSGFPLSPTAKTKGKSTNEKSQASLAKPLSSRNDNYHESPSRDCQRSSVSSFNAKENRREEHYGPRFGNKNKRVSDGFNGKSGMKSNEDNNPVHVPPFKAVPPATGVMSICGTRQEMEDSVTVVHKFVQLSCMEVGGCSGACRAHSATQYPLHFFGVYDGHGGSQVSKFCKDRLHTVLIDEIHESQMASTNSNVVWEKKWLKVMASAFNKLDAEIEDHAPVSSETVGSTAVVALVGSCQIIVANCGDSRAVLSRGGRAVPLSVDHKPNREDETARIEAAGGKVIYWNGYRVFGVLAMSRAIGDWYLRPYVIAEPEVMCVERSEDDDCLILASDGLWDVMSNEDVCDVARRCLVDRHNVSNGSNSSAGNAESAAQAAALLLTKMAIAQGSSDNISVIVVDLSKKRRPS